MKNPVIRRIVAVAALAIGIPLVGIGMRGFTAHSGESGKAAPGPILADNPVGRRHEIQLKGGTGRDIQKALLSLPTQGGRVMLSAGTYIIREPIVMDRDDQELAGDQELTILKLDDRVNCPLLVVGQEVFFQRDVVGSRDAAFPRARDRADFDQTIGQADMHLGRGTDDGEVVRFQDEHVGRRIHGP